MVSLNAIDYGKGMNATGYGLKELGWNAIIEIGNVTREELRLSVMLWWKPITEHHLGLKLKIRLIDFSMQPKVFKTNRDTEFSIFLEIGYFLKKGWCVEIYDTSGFDGHVFLIFLSCRFLSFWAKLLRSKLQF